MEKIIVEPFQFVISIFFDKEECMNWLHEKHPQDVDTMEKLKNCEGLAMKFETNPVFGLYLKNLESLDHEIIHLTWYILEYAGIEFDSSNHEIQAYLFEHIKRLILSKTKTIDLNT